MGELVELIKPNRPRGLNVLLGSRRTYYQLVDSKLYLTTSLGLQLLFKALKLLSLHGNSSKSFLNIIYYKKVCLGGYCFKTCISCYCTSILVSLYLIELKIVF